MFSERGPCEKWRFNSWEWWWGWWIFWLIIISIIHRLSWEETASLSQSGLFTEPFTLVENVVRGSHPEPIKNKSAVCSAEWGLVSLLESELSPPKDMEGLAVETKWAWGNKSSSTLTHVSPVCRTCLNPLPAEALKPQITSNERLWWFELKKMLFHASYERGYQHTAFSLVHTSQHNDKLPLKMEQLRTVGSVLWLRFCPDLNWIHIRIKGESVTTCGCAAWMQAHKPYCLQEGVSLCLDLQFKRRLLLLLHFELGTMSQAGNSKSVVVICWVSLNSAEGYVVRWGRGYKRCER